MKCYNITDTFFLLLLIISSLGLFVLYIILLTKQPNEIPENKVDDIIIKGFTSLNFIETKSIPNYTESNLGVTGKIILDCYTGKCPKKVYYYDSDGYSTYDYVDTLNYDCSEQCSVNAKDNCNNCDDPDKKIGKCSKKYDDKYEKGKYCYADNVIYFWKGKKYQISKQAIDILFIISN